MPFEAKDGQRTFRFTFTDLLGLVTVLASLAFQFYAGFFLSKIEMKDNTTLIQILTNISNYIMLVLTFYFGSNLIAAKQAAGQTQQIAALQNTANQSVLNAAMPNGKVAEAREDAIIRLQKELDDLEPESDEAKKIVLELEALNKIS